MLYTLNTTSSLPLNWSSKGIQRILQNVQNLINTWKYEVAYRRTMGLKTSILDLPLEKAKAEYIAGIYQVVGEYEPRASVKEVKFLGIDSDGNMDFKVVVYI